MLDKQTLTHASGLADQLVHTAGHAIKSTENVANEALDSMRDASRHLRDNAQHISRSTVTAIKDDPIKAILIAAATGAALMALVSLVTHSGTRH